jgi:hopene-associated glycosyltransferase HpnB
VCQAVLVPVLIVASVLALLAWVYLLTARGGYWRTGHRLPPTSVGEAGRPAQHWPDQRWPAVVAVVPARDEAEILPETLPTLLAQQYPGPFTVVLVDDESTDATTEVAAALAGQAVAPELRIVPGEPTPPGWTGKVWAMRQGLRAAPDAEFVLFTDADIAYEPGTLRALVAAAVSGEWALVSQMALLRSASFAERLLIPAFVYFFAQLYPFSQVSRPGTRNAAAAGGCMLVRRDSLIAAGGLERIRGARIDDVALAGLMKQAGGACWLGFTTQVVSRRRYDRLAEIWNMVARSAYTQLRYSPALLAVTVLGLTWLYLVPVAAALIGLAVLARGAPGQRAAWLAAAGLGAWALMSVSYLPVLRLSRLSALRAPSLPFIGLLYAAMTVSSAWRHHAGHGGEWKGRTIALRRMPGRP